MTKGFTISFSNEEKYKHFEIIVQLVKRKVLALCKHKIVQENVSSE